MKSWVLTLILAGSGALVAQNDPPHVLFHGHCDDGLPHAQQWLEHSGVASGKPYIASAARKQQITDGYSKLKLQMSREEVEKLMGDADYSAPKPSGHLATAPEPNPPVCSDQLAYLLKKDSVNMADMGDVGIYVFFSPENRLYWATPLNIDSLKPLGSPVQ